MKQGQSLCHTPYPIYVGLVSWVKHHCFRDLFTVKHQAWITQWHCLVTPILGEGKPGSLVLQLSLSVFFISALLSTFTIAILFSLSSSSNFFSYLSCCFHAQVLGIILSFSTTFSMAIVNGICFSHSVGIFFLER